MKSRWMVLVAAIALAAGAPTTQAVGESAQKETVCLVTKDQPDREMTRQVTSAAADRLVSRTLSYRGPCAEYGESAQLGNGEMVAYSQRIGDRPVSIGIAYQDAVFDGLPVEPPTSGLWCYDRDGDGTIENTGDMPECAGGHERKMDLSPAFKDAVDTPFTYALNNWNPHGHIPQGIYDKPHFDVHFYINDNADRIAIRPGPCHVMVNCDDYVLGKILPDAKYIAPDYVDVDALEPAMGNHLIDVTGPEFSGTPWKHSWIYGSWDGEITFYEAMVGLEWFNGLRNGTIEDACYDFKLPQAWQKSGWYPTSYCLRHRDNRGEVTVSLEDWAYRTAS